MRELTSSNDWSTPLRGANQPFDRQNLLHNQTLRVHYTGESAGQLAHSASKKEKLEVRGATQYSYCKAKRNLSEEV